MDLVLLLLLSFISGVTEANPKYSPRMIFSDGAKTLPLRGHHAPVQILLDGQPDTVIAAGQRHLNFYNFQNPTKTPPEKELQWHQCGNKACNYNITVVHWRTEGSQLFVCGTDGEQSQCCGLNLTEQSPTCVPSDKLEHLSNSITEHVIKEGEQADLVETERSADLYITSSGSRENPGLYKFGEKTVRPLMSDKEQHYVGLTISKRRNNLLQDKAYAFYKQKNSDTGEYSDMWLPFVTRVCMSDRGGPKNKLQYRWTSQLNAKLFCGNSDTRQYFSELVDTATVHADHWSDTKIYALFRNEWGMSAVCVYTIGDIDKVFATSAFKGFSTDVDTKTRRECVAESDKLSMDILNIIEKTTEMDEWVQPVNKSGPILFNDHNYTHIYVDKTNNDSTVLFLSLDNGGIHKVMHNDSDTFVIAEYQPFKLRTHILGMLFHPSSRMLYVYTGSEVAQVDMANCEEYGQTCTDCFLSRDPYCDWNGRNCARTTGNQMGKSRRNTATCAPPSVLLPSKASRGEGDVLQPDEPVITISNNSKYYLNCPVSSRHAQYTWHSPTGNTSCNSEDEQCLLLIDHMDPKQEGTHTCVSEEMGSVKVLAQYRLQLENRGVGQRPSPVLWVCLVFVMIKSWFCG